MDLFRNESDTGRGMSRKQRSLKLRKVNNNKDGKWGLGEVTMYRCGWGKIICSSPLMHVSIEVLFAPAAVFRCSSPTYSDHSCFIKNFSGIGDGTLSSFSSPHRSSSSVAVLRGLPISELKLFSASKKWNDVFLLLHRVMFIHNLFHACCPVRFYGSPPPFFGEANVNEEPHRRFSVLKDMERFLKLLQPR